MTDASRIDTAPFALLQLDLDHALRASIEQSSADLLAKVCVPGPRKPAFVTATGVYNALNSSQICKLSCALFPDMNGSLHVLWDANSCQEALHGLYERLRVGRREGWPDVRGAQPEQAVLDDDWQPGAGTFATSTFN